MRRLREYTEPRLTTDTVYSTFKVIRGALIIGCSSCDGGLGWLKILNERTFETLNAWAGSATISRVGERVELSEKDEKGRIRFY